MKTKEKLSTNQEITWCPGCYNFFILESVKQALSTLIEQGANQTDFAMTTDIGCSSKIYDYLNISGIYGLHGRALPTALGIKLANPKLKVLAFSGDGGIYSEGISHFIHAGRYNADMTLIVHDNQTFALTTGQATPTSQQGFKTKAEPLGEFNKPLNPIELALSSGATFVARTYSKNIEETAEIIKQAIEHKGFSFVEIIQPCLHFNLEMKKLEDMMYKINNKNDFKKAMAFAGEWSYNSTKKKIPLGIFYQIREKTLGEKWSRK